eukprot:m51a1_g3709 putative family 3 adenylate cyclase (461) ;mRNA; r:434256-435753
MILRTGWPELPELSQGIHVFTVTSNLAELFTPFIIEGINEGSLCAVVAGPHLRAEVEKALPRPASILWLDPTAVSPSARGSLTPLAALAELESYAGPAGIRVIADCSWSPDMVTETVCDILAPMMRAVVVCAYGLGDVADLQLVLDLCDTHTVGIVRGHIVNRARPRVPLGPLAGLRVEGRVDPPDSDLALLVAAFAQATGAVAASVSVGGVRASWASPEAAACPAVCRERCFPTPTGAAYVSVRWSATAGTMASAKMSRLVERLAAIAATWLAQRETPCAADPVFIDSALVLPVASVAIIDIVAFTELCSRHEAAFVARLAGSLISRWAASAEGLRLRCIKAMGDCVLVVGSPALPGCDAAHADRALGFALAALQIVRSYNRETGSGVQVRVGVCTGKLCIAKPSRYCSLDIWGSTVNKAQRLQCAADPGTCLVASETLEALTWEDLRRDVASRGREVP